MTAKRFIIDDAGTLIDMTNRNTYDYVSDVCGLLNELHEENQRLQEENKELEKFKHFIFKSLNQIYEDKE